MSVRKAFVFRGDTVGGGSLGTLQLASDLEGRGDEVATVAHGQRFKKLTGKSNPELLPSIEDALYWKSLRDHGDVVNFVELVALQTHFFSSRYIPEQRDALLKFNNSSHQ